MSWKKRSEGIEFADDMHVNVTQSNATVQEVGDSKKGVEGGSEKRRKSAHTTKKREVVSLVKGASYCTKDEAPQRMTSIIQ